jgi:hypothetical protein
MNVTYPDIYTSPEDRVLLQKATELLERTIGTTSSGLASIGNTSGIRATWTLEQRNRRPVYVLKLSDATSNVSDDFLPSELRDQAKPPMLPFRLARLWGDLLEQRSHRQLGELMKGRQE